MPELEHRHEKKTVTGQLRDADVRHYGPMLLNANKLVGKVLAVTPGSHFCLSCPLTPFSLSPNSFSPFSVKALG
jgi:hypothetical protein